MATKEQMDFLNNTVDGLEGFEDINSQTMAIPFLKIAQDLSPQMKKSKAEYIEGLELGDFFNSTTKEVYGKDINIIILKFDRMYIEWLPNRGGFVGYHTPENAERIAIDTTFGKWKTAEGNDLKEYYAYYCVIEGHEKEGPLVLSLTSTALSSAKELNRLITTHIMANGNRAMPYYLVVNVKSVEVHKNENDWYRPQFAIAGYIDENQYQIVGAERKELPNKTVDYAMIEDKTASKHVDEDDF